MNDNERKLLLKDLGARIGSIVYMGNKNDNTFYPLCIDDLKDVIIDEEFDDVPLLRAMEDMTEDDMEDYAKCKWGNDDIYKLLDVRKTGKDFVIAHCTLWRAPDHYPISFQVGKHTALHDGFHGIDWLNEHHFDYRGLIGRGLAIRVTDENNPYKTK